MPTPALFLPHGGGPLPILGDPMHEPMVKFLTGKARSVLKLDSTCPKAILLITAHWETTDPTISSSAKHSLLYDYYGFPKEAYSIKYDAPGDPAVARRVKEVLEEDGFNAKLDDKRGWDHGVFVPLSILRPEADIPLVQMSVMKSQNAKQHLKLGKALEKLRDEGVMIIGSGMSFHNMMAFRSSGFSNNGGINNKEFHKQLTNACEQEGGKRGDLLKEWENWPEATYSHPKGHAEHFMPLLVVAGAAGDAKGKEVFKWDFANHYVGGYVWN